MKLLSDLWQTKRKYMYKGVNSSKEYVPVTLRPTTLLVFAVACIGLIATLEVLVRSKSFRPGVSALITKRDDSLMIWPRQQASNETADFTIQTDPPVPETSSEVQQSSPLSTSEVVETSISPKPSSLGPIFSTLPSKGDDEQDAPTITTIPGPLSGISFHLPSEVAGAASSTSHSVFRPPKITGPDTRVITLEGKSETLTFTLSTLTKSLSGAGADQGIFVTRIDVDDGEVPSASFETLSFTRTGNDFHANPGLFESRLDLDPGTPATTTNIGGDAGIFITNIQEIPATVALPTFREISSTQSPEIPEVTEKPESVETQKPEETGRPVKSRRPTRTRQPDQTQQPDQPEETQQPDEPEETGDDSDKVHPTITRDHSETKENQRPDPTEESSPDETIIIRTGVGTDASNGPSRTSRPDKTPLDDLITKTSEEGMEIETDEPLPPDSESFSGTMVVGDDGQILTDEPRPTGAESQESPKKTRPGSSPSSSKPVVTLVAVDESFRETHTGPLLTIHTTDENQKSTTLYVIESPKDSPTASARKEGSASPTGKDEEGRSTSKPKTSASSGFQATFEADGKLTTIKTTREDGASTTILAFAPTITSAPVIQTTFIPISPVNTALPNDAKSKESNTLSADQLEFQMIYFGAQYLPTLLAVLLSMFWKFIDTDIKRTEPFYQMSSNEGASHTALTENLLFTNTFAVPFIAAARKQWVVFFSSLVYFVLSLTPFLAALSFSLSTRTKCTAVGTVRNCGNPFLIKDAVVVRILQGFLAAVTVAVIIVMVLITRRRLLLYSEPWSIAGLSTLIANWRGIQIPFESVSPYDSERDIKVRVRDNNGNYRLRLSHRGDDGIPSIELINSSCIGEYDAPRSSTRSQRPLLLRTSTIIVFILFLCGLLSILMVYRFTSNSAIESFMSGQSMGVAAFFVVLGIIIRSGWELIEREARYTETVHALSKRNQSSAILFRDYPRSIPLVSETLCLLRGDLYIAWIGMVGLLVEALVIVLSGVPFSGTQTWKDWTTCMTLSMVIVVLVALTLVAGLVRRRRIEKAVPRVPYTIATMVAYLYASKMLAQFEGLSMVETGVRNRRVRDGTRGMRFGLGWNMCVDGLKRVGIDQEELLGGYRVSGEKRDFLERLRR